MSLRRKSCNACFRGRRKCDLAFPACQRCQKTGKTCEYYSRERLPVTAEYTSSTLSSVDDGTGPHNFLYTDAGVLGGLLSPLREPCQESLLDPNLDPDLHDFNFDFTIPTLPLVPPNLLGELGDVQPVQGSRQSWQWVAEQLRDCPGQFAKTGENMFIHRSMYRRQSPRAIETAFGICTASLMVTPATEAIFTSAVESEVRALLEDVEVKTLAEGLARLQAMVLYQILRLLSGDSKQQSAAEQQKSVTNAWALQLLQQMHAGLPPAHAAEDGILGESVRRTVMVTYLLHALSSVFKHGVCTELPTLALLPVNADPAAWESSDETSASAAGGGLDTMKYGEWTEMWSSCPPRRRLDPFQKMLMAACKGKAKVEELEAETV